MEQALKSEKPVFLEITKEQSERINIYKAILAIMVVFIHAYTAKEIPALSEMNYVDIIQYVISQVICRCAVPAYFFLSALFLYRKPFNYKTNLIRKLKTLGIPYLIMNTVWIVFFLVAKFIPVIGGMISNPENNVLEWGVVDYLDAYLGFQNGYPMLYPLWFIRDLIVLNILATVIEKLVEKIPVVSMVIAIIAWLVIPKTGVFFLGMQSIVFWILGCSLCKSQFGLSVFEKIPEWLISVLYVLFIIVDTLTIDLKAHLIIHNIGIIVGMLFWYVCVTKWKESKFKKSLLVVSSYSFGIYIFHESTLTLFQKVCVKILPDGDFSLLLQYFMIPIIVTVGCVILCMLLKRFVPEFYKLLTGSR